MSLCAYFTESCHSFQVKVVNWKAARRRAVSRNAFKSSSGRFSHILNWLLQSAAILITITMMIRKFRHKGLRRFFNDPRYSDKRGIHPKNEARLIAILDALDVIEKAEEMDISGLYFHKLKGSRKNEYSVRVTGNWRITWKMDGENVIDVNLEDYH